MSREARRVGEQGCLRVKFAAERDGAGHAILVVEHDLDGELNWGPTPQLRQVDVRADPALRDRLRRAGVLQQHAERRHCGGLCLPWGQSIAATPATAT